MINGKVNLILGWIMASNIERYDELLGIIEFYHKEYGYIKCSQNELTKKYNLVDRSISNLVRKKVKSLKGWILYKNINDYDKIMSFHNVKYKFYNKDYGEVECRQFDLVLKYNLDNAHVSRLVQERGNWYKGWVLSKYKDDYNKILKIFKFKHDIYGIEECTQMELCNKYNLIHQNLHATIKGKRSHCKGWKILNI